jgi:hypothetical protein
LKRKPQYPEYVFSPTAGEAIVIRSLMQADDVWGLSDRNADLMQSEASLEDGE